MSRLGKPLIQSTATHLAQLAISLGLVVVVSRILPPAEVGVYLMAYAVVLLVLPLRDFQIQSFLIQREEVNTQTLRAVSFAAWGSATVALLICLVGAAIFSWFAAQPDIAICLLILSGSFVLRPLALPAIGLLSRELDYGSLAWIRLCAALAKVIVTLGLLAGGMGAEALAWGIVAETAVEVAAVFKVPQRHRFILPHRTGSREVVAYCAPFSGAHMVITFSVALTPLFIGGYQGLAMTAFFNRGRTLMQFFRSSVEGAVQPIVLAEFSRVRDNLDELHASFVSATSLLTALTWPALAWLIVVAEPLVILLFGEAWALSGDLAQILAAGAMIYCMTALSPQLHAALNETKLLLARDTLLQLPLVVLLVVTAPISVEAVAKAFVAYAVLNFAVHYVLLRRSIGLGLRHAVGGLAKSAFVAVAVALGTLFVMEIAALPTPAWSVLLAGAAGAVLWISALVIARHDLLLAARHWLAGEPALGRGLDSGERSSEFATDPSEQRAQAKEP